MPLDAGVNGGGRPPSWISPLGRWHWRQPTAWRISDATLAVCVLTSVMVAGNLNHMPRGLAEFLAIRVSVKNVLLLAGFAWVWPIVLTVCGLYAPNRLRTGDGEWPRLAFAAALGCAVAMVFPATSVSGLITPLHIVAFGLVIVPADRFLRTIIRAVDRNRPRPEPRQVILIGSGPLAKRLYRQLLVDPLRNVSVVGFVDSEPHDAMVGTGSPHLGVIDDLEMILMRRVVDDVFIGLPVRSRYDEIQESLAACARVGVRASYSGDFFGSNSGELRADSRAAPVLSMSHTPRPDLLAAKRAMDLVGAAILLIILAPVMALIALAIKITSPGPVMFAQDRYGYMKRLFRMYKFRTMVADAEHLHAGLEGHNEASGPVFKMRDDPRVTWVGRVLRRTSVDELPQLWHVLTGDMSLVGPRPLPTRDVGLFPEPWLMRRFSVHPGLTCLWQISGRSNVGFDQWIALDLQYIDNWSLWLDLRILIRTLPAILRGAGAM